MALAGGPLLCSGANRSVSARMEDRRKVQEATRVDEQELRPFIAEHFRRNPNCDWDHVASGFRVKYGRPMDSRETALAREAFEEEEVARDERLEAEWEAAQARKPKGPINKFLAMRWQGQMLLGLAVFLIALYVGCAAFYSVIARGTLFGGTAATGSSSSFGQSTLSQGRALEVPVFDHPGVQAATSFLFWTVLVTGGVGGVVILFVSWGIGYGILRGCRALLRRPSTG